MTQLRKMMLDELQRRNYAQSTVDAYISALRDFAEYFKRPPDQLGPDHIRQFQLHLLRDRKLATNTVKQRMAAIQFFFARTLKRPYLRDDFPYPKSPKRLPAVLSQEEVSRLIDSASNLSHRVMLRPDVVREVGDAAGDCAAVASLGDAVVERGEDARVVRHEGAEAHREHDGDNQRQDAAHDPGDGLAVARGASSPSTADGDDAEDRREQASQQAPLVPP